MDRQSDSEGVPKLIRKYGITPSPSLDYRESVQLITEIRKKFPRLTEYQYLQDVQEHRVRNGSESSLENEWLFRINPDEVTVAWGQNVAKDDGEALLREVVRWIVDGSGTLRIAKFDAAVTEIVKFVGNQYDLIARAFLRDDATVAFADKLCEKHGARIGDNDLKLLFYFGSERTGALTVTGSTSRAEIETEKFAREALSVTFGILQDKIPYNERPMAELMLANGRVVEDIFRGLVTTTVVQPLLTLSENRHLAESDLLRGQRRSDLPQGMGTGND